MAATLLDQFIEPFAECLTADAAQKVVALRADKEVQAAVDDLAAKANLGTLTPEEAAAYDRYLACLSFRYGPAGQSTPRTSSLACIDAAIRQFVRDRAANRCEYCKLPQHVAPYLRFHIEHIVAQ